MYFAEARGRTIHLVLELSVFHNPPAGRRHTRPNPLSRIGATVGLGTQ